MAAKPSAQLLSIPCPGCKARAKIPASKVTAKGVTYTCPACKVKVRLARTAKGIAVKKLDEPAPKTPETQKSGKKGKPKVKIEQGAPLWVITFADLATLLLTFFVLMLSFANMDIIKFNELMGSVQESFGVTRLEKGQYQAVSSGKLADVDSNIKESAAAVARERLVNVIADSIIREGFKSAASITSTDEGVRVRVKGRALFEPGGSELGKGSLKFLKELSNVIKSTKNMYVVVEGHTDNRPIRTKRFPSNWELSTLRASAVLEKMIAFGAPADRMSAAGYADTRPLFSNDLDETRPLNRRVEFLFKRG